MYSQSTIKAIAEHCEDKVWGDGKDGTGKNLLGKILMQVREELREEQSSDKKKRSAPDETVKLSKKQKK